MSDLKSRSLKLVLKCKDKWTWLSYYALSLVVWETGCLQLFPAADGQCITSPSTEVSEGSPSHGGDAAVYVFDINQLSLPIPFYSVLVSISAFMALSTVFYSIHSPDNSPLSHSVLLALFLPYWSFQLYLFMKVSLNPDIILWLGLKHQLTKLLTSFSGTRSALWRTLFVTYFFLSPCLCRLFVNP